MTVTDISKLKELRERTNLSMGDCRKALQESEDDIEKAVEWLRANGKIKASELTERNSDISRIFTYNHPGNQLASMVQVACESDFVAKTDAFMTFGAELALHVAAAKPWVVDRGLLSDSWFDKERGYIMADIRSMRKVPPASMIKQIVQSKLDKRMSEIVLLEQPFVKDDKRTIEDLRAELAAKTGENIKIVKFARYDASEKA